MQQHPTETTTGLVEGIVRTDCTEFRGIPYAAAPCGETRFLAPRPHPGWSGVRLAQAFGAAAPQESSPVMGIDRSDDDCLFLNLVTPAVDGGRRPVLVWLHGGGFLSGCGHQALYNARHLAVTGDCVVVTCNYRLGLFGFADFAGVLGAGFPADTNVGLHDQIAVLRWVRDNIANVGGDPCCVTILGESAGGMSVAALLATPAARGLFHRAIVQSGGADFVVDSDQARQTTEIALAALADTHAARVAALLHGDAAAILSAQREVVKITVDRGIRNRQTPQFGMTLLPVVDGGFLPQRPLDAIAQGNVPDIPLLASVTRDEWNLFVHQPQFAGGRNLKAEEMDDARLAHVFERALPGRATAALAIYANARDRQDNGMLIDRLCWMESDRMFRFPTHHMVAAHAAQGRRAYLAQFEWCCPQFGGRLGACHVVDVPFVFGLTSTPVGQFFTGGGAAADALSRQVMASWTAFARDGIPAPINDEPFRPVRADAVTAVRIGPDKGTTALADAATQDFWQFIGPSAPVSS